MLSSGKKKKKKKGRDSESEVEDDEEEPEDLEIGMTVEAQYGGKSKWYNLLCITNLAGVTCTAD